MKIALITDTHLAAEALAFRENCDAVRDWVAELRPDLTIHLGDITVDGSKYPEQLGYAAEVFTGWPSELRFLPGNHDIGDNIDLQHHSEHEPRIDAERLALYRATFGPDRWSFRGTDWTIVGLNAQLFGAGDDLEREQLAWLDEVVAEVDGPLGLMLHKPLFRNGHADTERHHRYLPIPERRALTDRLGSKDLRFVVSGHTHQHRRIVVDGVEHVWAPSSAFLIPDTIQERIGDKVVGVMILSLTPDGHAFDFVEPNGVGQHSIGDHLQLYPQLG